ncbi:hypothetical protein B0I35DRAFT_253353 [Stachybotrys elegans]|uniref:Uncharacterized protein n=1 Tax=Stachybotrys elegans TaxID=80388 RepID=A0A8K0WQR2_9HYPO|nr:hypothetical protein B0I35DRAFT_253353 [Stachybotrys elegans]
MDSSLPHSALTNGETSRFRTVPNGSPSYDENSNGTDDRRPSSAPGRKNGNPSAGAKDDTEPPKPRRPVKPTLQRSKSEYAPRAIENEPQAEDEIPQWGARHGFEDHYQSEHIISQLASVCFAFFPCQLYPFGLAPPSSRRS